MDVGGRWQTSSFWLDCMNITGGRSAFISFLTFKYLWPGITFSYWRYCEYSDIWSDGKWLHIQSSASYNCFWGLVANVASMKKSWMRPFSNPLAAFCLDTILIFKGISLIRVPGKKNKYWRCRQARCPGCDTVFLKLVRNFLFIWIYSGSKNTNRCFISKSAFKHLTLSDMGCAGPSIFSLIFFYFVWFFEYFWNYVWIYANNQIIKKNQKHWFFWLFE